MLKLHKHRTTKPTSATTSSTATAAAAVWPDADDSSDDELHSYREKRLHELENPWAAPSGETTDPLPPSTTAAKAETGGGDAPRRRHPNAPLPPRMSSLPTPPPSSPPNNTHHHNSTSSASLTAKVPGLPEDDDPWGDIPSLGIHESYARDGKDEWSPARPRGDNSNSPAHPHAPMLIDIASPPPPPLGKANVLIEGGMNIAASPVQGGVDDPWDLVMSVEKPGVAESTAAPAAERDEAVQDDLFGLFATPARTPPRMSPPRVENDDLAGLAGSSMPPSLAAATTADDASPSQEPVVVDDEKEQLIRQVLALQSSLSTKLARATTAKAEHAKQHAETLLLQQYMNNLMATSRRMDRENRKNKQAAAAAAAAAVAANGGGVSRGVSGGSSEKVGRKTSWFSSLIHSGLVLFSPSLSSATDTLFTTTPSHRPTTTNYEQQPNYTSRFPAHHRAEQLSQTSFCQPSQTELSPDPESAFYTTRKRLLQQHRAVVAAVSWEESDDDGSSLPRRSSTSDLAALDNGFEDVGAGGGGSSAPALDERRLIDSSYGREARNQYPLSQFSQPSLHRRAFSSTIPRSLIPPRETTATTTTSGPWADNHPDYIDSFATSASAGFRTQSRTATSRTTTSWSDAATKFMETRPGDFGPVPTAVDLVQGISSIHLGPPAHGFHQQHHQHQQQQQQQGYQVGGPASAAVLDPKTLRQAMDFAAARGINPRNFETRPSNSSYFVIKSNSTFNILASLAHNVWASTELGNRRLHAAFHAASQNANNNSETDVNGGSVYLFFSVTSSGRFCGVARMASGVDWDHVEAIWEGGKRYKGTFELEWIFVKDVPNAAVRHLKVSTNENKPVSNSRDTQQVVEEIGHEMLRIFSQTSCMGHSALYDFFADPSELASTTITTGTATTGPTATIGADLSV
ncbi:hypothetical protein HDU89_007556 [Geranomyces variabilis]|nr:hypothetical protein HDU89_007556 [Geranomyces variabilis]